jgi:hypothetical protein
MTTLSAVKQYMELHRRATTAELAASLHTTADNARVLLEMWRAKKRVRVIPSCCDACGLAPACCACGISAPPEVYEWLGQAEGGP